jgi:hypothetical protein
MSYFTFNRGFDRLISMAVPVADQSRVISCDRFPFLRFEAKDVDLSVLVRAPMDPVHSCREGMIQPPEELAALGAVPRKGTFIDKQLGYVLTPPLVFISRDRKRYYHLPVTKPTQLLLLRNNFIINALGIGALYFNFLGGCLQTISQKPLTQAKFKDFPVEGFEPLPITQGLPKGILLYMAPFSFEQRIVLEEDLKKGIEKRLEVIRWTDWLEKSLLLPKRMAFIGHPRGRMEEIKIYERSSSRNRMATEIATSQGTLKIFDPSRDNPSERIIFQEKERKAVEVSRHRGDDRLKMLERTGLVSKPSLKERLIDIRGKQALVDTDLAEFLDVPVEVVRAEIARTGKHILSRFIFRLSGGERNEIGSPHGLFAASAPKAKPNKRSRS